MFKKELTILHDHCHRRTLIKNSELPLRALLIRRVGKDSAIAQCSVCIRDHRSDITRGVRLCACLSRVLDALEVCLATFSPV